MAGGPSSRPPDPSRPTFLPEDSDAAWRPAAKRLPLARAWQLPTLAVAVTVFVLVVVALFPRGRVVRSPEELLREIERRLSRKQHAAAVDLARAFMRTYEAPNADRALAHLYCGRGLREGGLTSDVPPPEALEAALTQFDYAAALPLPAEQREWAALWAGDCLQRLQQTEDAARRYLQGLALDGPAAGTLRVALVRLWSRSTKPNLAEINEQVDLALDDPRLAASEKAAALITAGEVAYRLQRWDEAERRFGQVISRSPDAGVAGRAHVYLARLAHRAGRYPQALSQARSHLARAEPEDRDAVTTAFILADSLLNTGRPGDALIAFRQLAADFPLDPEGEAAALREVRCHIRLEEGQRALARLTALLADAPPEAWSRNPWIDRADLRDLVDELRRFFFVRGQYAQVVALAHAARTLVSRQHYLETLSTAHRLIGEEEKRLAQAAGPDQADHGESARRALVQAGDDLVGLAEVTKTERVFVEHLWSAVECYREAQAYGRGAQALEAYIQNAFVTSKPAGDRYVQASYYLGECYAALGRPGEAVELFKRVVRDSPQNPYAYLARMAWARCCLNQGQLDEAKAVLVAIVEGGLFTPRSTVWRQAIFLLGEALHRNGEYEEAIRRLSEGVARFPDKPESQRGRYLLAESCRAFALALGEAIKRDTGPVRRATLQARRRARLADAIDHYRAVVERYEAQEAKGQALDGLDETQRRNSAFFLGDCCFEIGQYGQAIAAYEEAAFRYKDDPRAVSALVQVSEALRRQRKPSLARAAVQRARLILRGQPGDDLEKRPVGMTKQQWLAWLDWASRLE